MKSRLKSLIRPAYVLPALWVVALPVRAALPPLLSNNG